MHNWTLPPTTIPSAPAALHELRAVCLQSTIWRRPYPAGYIGAFSEFGFVSPIVFQIVEELKTALPTVLDTHRLVQWWAFTYDAQLPGTDIHGDDSDISLNLWLTRDAANLDPETGGLTIWNARAPDDWDFDAYNAGGDMSRRYLQTIGAEPMSIAYRENRAVIFEGRLFHQTSSSNFVRGFENRRRNLTLLFRRAARK